MTTCINTLDLFVPIFVIVDLRDHMMIDNPPTMLRDALNILGPRAFGYMYPGKLLRPYWMQSPSWITLRPCKSNLNMQDPVSI